MLIQLRRAITPEEIGERCCSLCGVSFWAGAVYAWPVGDDRQAIDDDAYACEECVYYFSKRNPQRFPSLEEYRAAVERYPEPILASGEEAIRLEDAAAWWEVYASSAIS